MTPYWLTFDGFRPGCVEAANDADARRIGTEKTGRTVLSCDRLPYPANPRLHVEVDPRIGEACPSFCYETARCKGKTSCPQHYACSE